MKARRATLDAVKWACRNYKIGNPSFDFAYNIYENDQWQGVILFREAEAGRFDKWKGQVEEIAVAMAVVIPEAVELAIDQLGKEAPWIDLVISDEQMQGFDYAGKFGNGKQGAYIVDGERYSMNTVKHNGWRQSVLWLRGHIDENAYQFDRDAKNLYLHAMNEQMAERIKMFTENVQ